MARKKYTIQYRYLNTENLPNANLQVMIVAAMRARQGQAEIGRNARARIIDLDQDGSFVILNRVTNPDGWDGGFFAAQLIHLQEGADVAAVLQSLEEDAEE